MDTAAQNEANVNLIYFKQMFPGQTITQPFDAVSLNYWGNSTWGGPPTLDLDHNLVYFGTGQSHAIPLGENLLLSQPQYNFSDLKIPVVDIITQYAAGTATLADVNQIKDIFVQEVQNGALDLQLKSPRGQMSYADAILGVYIMPTASHPAGTIAFGSRVVAADTYSFIPATPELLINPSSNSIDGDVSSGVALIKKGATRFVTTAAKSGLSLTLDLTNFKPWAQMKFNHANLSAVGVMPQKLILNGPNGFLGGSNYLSARAGSIHVSSQANMAWADGSVGSKGELEFEVTPDGQIFEINNSFIQGVDILTHKIIWSTPYNTRAGSQVVTHGHIAFAGDSFGSYYAFSTQDGHILWKYNAKPHGINGGIVGPQVAPDGQVIWINNYSAQGIIGQPGPNGIALRVNPKIMIRPCDTSRQILAHRTFKSWDTAPKLKFANPVIAPINNVTITHQWISKRCVDVIHQTEVTVLKATFAIKKFNAVAKIVTFVPTVGTLVYYSLRLINAHIYELRYEVEGVPSSAWLEIDPRSQV
jgi:prepilin-type processing-associated H-X9-DG protein